MFRIEFLFLGHFLKPGNWEITDGSSGELPRIEKYIFRATRYNFWPRFLPTKLTMDVSNFLWNYFFFCHEVFQSGSQSPKFWKLLPLFPLVSIHGISIRDMFAPVAYEILSEFLISIIGSIFWSVNSSKHKMRWVTQSYSYLLCYKYRPVRTEINIYKNLFANEAKYAKLKEIGLNGRLRLRKRNVYKYLMFKCLAVVARCYYICHRGLYI